ncbi:hypothetical protein ADUPG1_008877 [Aduncisulcus paluster]|uniref:Uncharacterized protein n=1 Tax=Aduncisulcus paluster TaxID=2918883 RepID=A0ABQ5KTK2_9EUKA|nr:hypothetical protein ADUPG1_008877 [Aduncisulcus paluster]
MFVTQKSFKFYSSCVHHAVMWRKHEGKILCKEAIAKLASEHAPSIKAKDVKQKLNEILKEKCLREGIVIIEDTIKEMITFLMYTINNCIAESDYTPENVSSRLRDDDEIDLAYYL